jgi:putative FmdB family regulatory protein
VPVSLRLRSTPSNERESRALCWVGETSLLTHLPRVAGLRRVQCTVRLHEPVLGAAGPKASERKAIARDARRRVERGVLRSAGCEGIIDGVRALPLPPPSAMPTFDFVCQACAHQFEMLVRSRDVPACPSCGSEALEKLLSMPQLKTTGTRALAMQAAKRRDKAQGTERMVEQAKYEASHDD